MSGPPPPPPPPPPLAPPPLPPQLPPGLPPPVGSGSSGSSGSGSGSSTPHGVPPVVAAPGGVVVASSVAPPLPPPHHRMPPPPPPPPPPSVHGGMGPSRLVHVNTYLPPPVAPGSVPPPFLSSTHLPLPLPLPLPPPLPPGVPPPTGMAMPLPLALPGAHNATASAAVHAPATAVVLTRIPPFLASNRALRDLVYAVGGGCRSVVIANHERLLPLSVAGAGTTTRAGSGKNRAVAVVRMGHAGAAANLVRNWDKAARILSGRDSRHQNDHGDGGIHSDKEDKDGQDSNHDAEFTLQDRPGRDVTAVASGAESKKHNDDAAHEPSTLGQTSQPVIQDTKQDGSGGRNDDQQQTIKSKNKPTKNLLTVVTQGHIVTMKAHLLSPDPTRIPDLTERDRDDSLAIKLVESYLAIKKQYDLTNATANAATAATTTKTATDSSIKNQTDRSDTTKPTDPTLGTDNDAHMNENNILIHTIRKLDTSKVAAAAGGGAYDEEADPLNAPEVLEAVARFKKRLEGRDAAARKRRAEYVDKRLGEEVRKARVRLEEERTLEKEKQRLLLLHAKEGHEKEGERTNNAEVPTLPSTAAAKVSPGPTPSDDIPTKGSINDKHSHTTLLPAQDATAKLAAKETGRRGVSNLPAWMTKKMDDTGAIGNTLDTDTGGRDASIKDKAEDDKNNDNDDDDNDNDDDRARKRKFVPSEVNRDFNARKKRLDTGEMTLTSKTMSLAEIRAANEAADRAAAKAEAEAPMTTTTTAAPVSDNAIKSSDPAISPPFPSLPIHDGTTSSSSSLSLSLDKALRSYVTSQIVEYLGEEETTLIEFVISQVKGRHKTLDMLEEMKTVLDEDAEDFVLGLYRKVEELATSAAATATATLL